MRGPFLRIPANLAKIWRGLRKTQGVWFAVGECRPVLTSAKSTVEVATDGAGDSCKELGPVEMKQAATLFLREWLYPLEIRKIRTLIEKHGHLEWNWHLHDKDIIELYPQEKKYAVLLSPQFGFGMQVRNALRRAGFGEQEFGVYSLDDVYVVLLEEAVQEEPSPDDGL